MGGYELSSAELAVLVDHMTGGRLLDDEEAAADLALDSAAAGAVEQQLLDRGLLLSLPFEEAAGVTSGLASVLSAAIAPELLVIVRSVQFEHTDPPVIFSFTRECITRNQLKGDGLHIFTELADREAALDAILAAGGADSVEPKTRKTRPQPLAELLEDSERMVTVLIVNDPDEDDAEPNSLGWLQTDGDLWLIAGSGDEEEPLAAPVGRSELRSRLAAEISEKTSA